MTVKQLDLFPNLKRRFSNSRISTKIMVFYSILLVFSVLSSSVLYQNIYSNTMRNKVGEVSMQTLSSINSNISSILENSKNLSTVIISSDEVQQPLKHEKSTAEPAVKTSSGQESADTEIITVDLAAQRRVNAYVSKFIEAFPFISSIYIYDNYSQRYGIDKLPLKRMKEADIRKAGWYSDAMNAQGGYILRLNAGDVFEDTSGETYISLIRIINDIYTQKPIGVLIINISEKSFVESYKDIVDQYDTDIMIMNGEGSVIVNFTNPVSVNIKEALSSSGDKKSVLIKENNKDYLVSYLDVEKYDWTIISLMPFDELSRESNIFSVIALVVIVLNSLLLFLGSIAVSRIITSPIKKLMRSMKGVEKGEFRRFDIENVSDEFGKLRDGYNIMISEIQALIDKVVEDQKMKRKAELDVLQAQIKPHFLYNTFDAISSLALSGRNDEAYRALKALGSYYRTSLSRGSEVITIGEEIDVVRNYLTIQQLRYGDIFTVHYDIDERVKKYKILKLILQPLVENALYHGIKLKGERGNIHIAAKHSQEQIVLSVEDDGVGISEEMLHKIIQGQYDDTKVSYGLRGTIERLRIFYGVNDLFTIESREYSGTRVAINIPIKSEGCEG
jgi:two-component system sensor histidine kinase YesM